MVGAEMPGVGESRADAAPEAMRIGTIEIGETGIAEYTREGFRTVFVPREGITRVSLGRGFTSERPIAAAVVGAACLGGAAAAIVALITADSVYIPFKFIAAIGFLALFGVLFLATLLRRGRYVRVITERDSRKLILHGAMDRAAMREVLQRAEARFGYPVDFTALDEM